MDTKSAPDPNSSDTTHLILPTSVKIEDIKSRPHPHYETAGARSTRMIIDSASYVTTPCDSPPNDLRYVFSDQDTHHKVPSVVALAKADQLLLESQEPRNCISSHNTQAEDTAVQRKMDDGNVVGETEDDVQHHVLPVAEELLRGSSPAPEHKCSKLHPGVSPDFVYRKGRPSRARSGNNKHLKRRARILRTEWLNAKKSQD
jgi:hypothetical protein